jgi:pyrophosphatase PpaX
LPKPFALLFDLDGTVIDSIELLLSSARHAFALHPGSGPTDAEWIAGIGTPLLSQLRQWSRTDEELQSLLENYRAFQREHHDRLTRCFDDVPETLRALRACGHKTAIVTSKIEELAQRSLEWVGLAHEFDTVIGFDATTRHKPEPEPVLLALERLGAEANRTVFVGDSPHDIAAGNAAGVISIAALWGPFSRESLEAARPRHLIERMGQLPALLDGLARGAVS